MADLLRQASDWLSQKRTAHLAGQVTYRRGLAELVVNATFGNTQYEVQDEFGLRVGAEVTDFLILADELAPVFDEPQAGDLIVADGVVHEVMPLAGLGHWRWSDQYRTTMRIHAKEVGADS